MRRLVLTTLTLFAAGFSVPASAATCVSALDTQMVRFVPRTPSSGPNPLFRLISGKREAKDAPRGCHLMQRTAAPPR